jgi:hypothetical protein
MPGRAGTDEGDWRGGKGVAAGKAGQDGLGDPCRLYLGRGPDHCKPHLCPRPVRHRGRSLRPFGRASACRKRAAPPDGCGRSVPGAGVLLGQDLRGAGDGACQREFRRRRAFGLALGRLRLLLDHLHGSGPHRFDGAQGRRIGSGRGGPRAARRGRRSRRRSQAPLRQCAQEQRRHLQSRCHDAGCAVRDAGRARHPRGGPARDRWAHERCRGAGGHPRDIGGSGGTARSGADGRRSAGHAENDARDRGTAGCWPLFRSTSGLQAVPMRLSGAAPIRPVSWQPGCRNRPVGSSARSCCRASLSWRSSQHC